MEPIPKAANIENTVEEGDTGEGYLTKDAVENLQKMVDRQMLLCMDPKYGVVCYRIYSSPQERSQYSTQKNLNNVQIKIKTRS